MHIKSFLHLTASQGIAKRSIASIRTYTHQHPRRTIVLIALSYLLVIAYYMTPQILSPMTTVYGFGDNTAGAIWRYDVSPSSPFWGYENETNYPFGESLSSPVHFSGSVQYITYWLLSMLLGPILGYNVLNIAGFLLSALVMFGFIKWITGRPWIAWLAGYAVAFSPYYQMKVGGHPTYGYQAIFIGLLWLFVRLVKYQRMKDAVFLGLLFAVAAYFDVYLTLFSAVILVSLGLAWLIVNRRALLTHSAKLKTSDKGSIGRQAKLMGVAGAIALAAVLPLAIFFAIQHQQINADVAAARGDVFAEAKACSNWPHEYLVPFVLNPFLEQLTGKDRYQAVVNVLRNNFTCGIGEDSIGLSLTLVFVVGVGSLILIWERINRTNLRLQKLIGTNAKLLVLSVIFIAFAGVAIGFPPLKFHNILPTPSYELLAITTTWRTLARAYMIVNLALVIAAAIVLAYFTRHFAKNKRLLAVSYLVILLGIFIEYQAFMPLQGNTLSNFNYKRDVPSTYLWLTTQDKINVVAEYPLEREGGESDAGSYYLTMQTTHKKKLFNSALSNSPEDAYRTGLKDLADPQTIPALRAFGVDAIIVHGVAADEVAKLPGVSVKYSAPQSKFNLLSHTATIKNDTIVVADISNAPKAAYLLSFDKGFVRNTNIIKSVVDWQYEAVSPSRLNVMDFTRGGKLKPSSTQHEVCFDVKMSIPDEVDTLFVQADGLGKVELGRINGTYTHVRFAAMSKAALSNASGHNMRVTQIGCQQ